MHFADVGGHVLDDPGADRTFFVPFLASIFFILFHLLFTVVPVGWELEEPFAAVTLVAPSGMSRKLVRYLFVAGWAALVHYCREAPRQFV
jgi:hypothetical protein